MYSSVPAAYDAGTGELLWERWQEYGDLGDHNGDDLSPGHGLAVSPDGNLLIDARHTNGDPSYLHTIAIDADTGERVWTASHDVEGTLPSVDIDPQGERVYVTGMGGTAAYDLETGETQWVIESGFGGDGFATGGGFDILAGPDGEAVYVAVEGGSDPHRAIALDAATGAIEWTAEAPDASSEQLYGVDLGPDGQTFVLAGGSVLGYVVAFDTEEGAPLWDADLDTAQTVSEDRWVDANDAKVGPNGEAIFVHAVAGGLPGGTAADHSFVVAYDARSGEERWTAMEDGDFTVGGLGTLALAPDGSRVYSQLNEGRTVALDAATGEKVWSAIYENNPVALAYGLVVSPDGSRIFAEHYGHLVAYETGPPHLLQENSVDLPHPTASDEGSRPPTGARTLGQQDFAAAMMGSIGMDSSQRDQAINAARTAIQERIQTTTSDGHLAYKDAFDHQQANLDLSEAILEVADEHQDPGGAGIEEGLAVAELAVADRLERLDEGPSILSENLHGPLRQSQANLGTAKDLLHESERDVRGDLAEAVALAKRVGMHQGQALGIALDEAPPPSSPSIESPGNGARELANRYDLQLSGEQREQLQQLDDLPDAVGEAVAAVLVSFLAYDTAVKEAFADAGLPSSISGMNRPILGDGTEPRFGAIETERVAMSVGQAESAEPANVWSLPEGAQMPASRDSPSEMAQDTGLDVSPILRTRHGLLDAVLDLEEALDHPDVEPADQLSGLDFELRVPPALAIDLASTDDVYEEDYALLIDVGGQDRYANNAGGSGLRVDQEGDCRLEPTDVSPRITSASAMFDLGNGDDAYTSPGRSCGVRGGGYLGSGLLVDAGGSDVYAPRAPDGIATDNQTTRALTDTPKTAFDRDQHTQAAEARTPSARQDSGPASTDEHDTTEKDAGGRYVVGLQHDTSMPEPGEQFQGEAIVETSRSLAFVVVEPDDPDAFLSSLRDARQVRYVHEDVDVELDVEPNDPRFGKQHGLGQVGAPSAWSHGYGDRSASLCIVDSGVDLSHPDIDEARHIGGYDFVNDDTEPTDGYGHGTHMAGIAAATIDNGEGIAGVGNVGFQAVKVFDDRGRASLSDVAKGVQWCAENEADVVSMSFSYPDPIEGVPSLPDPLFPDHTAMEEAIGNAAHAGALLVSSAGNDGCFDCIDYPAAFEDVIAVTCTDRDRELCSFSSHGPEAELAAPGEEVLSAVPRSFDEAYLRASGTSMSTAFVSGAATLVASQANDLSGEALRQLLRDSAEDLGVPGCEERFGHGLLDAGAAVQAAIDGEAPTLQGSAECLAGGFFGTNGGGHLGLGLLVSAGDGNDTFRSSGVGTNGGGAVGLGGLVSGGGNNTYIAGSTGTNGGGAASHDVRSLFTGADTLAPEMNAGGLGVLVDAGASTEDIYVAGGTGTNGGASAAGVGFLLDRGGHDRFVSTSRGTNGGGWNGAGFLLDAAGAGLFVAADRGTNGGAWGSPTAGGAAGLLIHGGDGDTSYDATHRGTNDAARFGSGFLVDTGGDDEFNGTRLASNGGGYFYGSGFLVDFAGNDNYRATDGATNGGVLDQSYGFLLDADGNNTFAATHHGTNGGAALTVGGSTQGVGFLFGAGSGDTTYEASHHGANGGSAFGGIGLLADEDGDDTYDATHTATNGGNAFGGYGFLVDGGGSDAYEATWRGTNGGAATQGYGLLFDIGGDDRYNATKWGTNGGGWQSQAAGFLLDADGNDIYVTESHAANGGGAGGSGFLADEAGDDTYIATDYATNGGGFFGQRANDGDPTEDLRPGIVLGKQQENVRETRERGILVDRRGNDTYIGGECGANGGSATSDCLVTDEPHTAEGPGLLLDSRGGDGYSDALVECRDCSKIPKGAGGAAQIDAQLTPAALLGEGWMPSSGG